MKTMSKISNTAIIGFSVFLCITLILHFLQPEYEVSQRYISEFMLGESGWLLNIAITGNLIGCTAFTIAFYQFHRSHKSVVCLVCLCVATLSVLTNYFPTDVHGKAVSISGHIHNWGAFIGALAIFPVMIIFPLQLKRLGKLKGLYIALLLLGPLAPLAFVLLLSIANSAPAYVGIAQRAYALFVMTWLILAAFKLKTFNSNH